MYENIIFQTENKFTFLENCMPHGKHFITVQLDPHLWRFLGLQRIRALISKRRQPVFLSSPLQVADVVFELLQHMVCKTLNYALSMGKGLCDRDPLEFQPLMMQTSESSQHWNLF